MEVEVERESGHRHVHFVVRRKVYDLLWGRTRTFDCHLLRFKLNLMSFGCADDCVTELLIRIEGIQPDIGAGLPRQVPSPR